ncbi:MAG: hypothetical protein AAFY28_17135, partial [Actinomycetota bacterium]
MSIHDTHPEWVDEFGLVGPLPASDGQRQHRVDDEPSGPAIGARLPDFTLPSSSGRNLSFHADRAGHTAAVTF